MREQIEQFDARLIAWLRSLEGPLSRLAIFLVYFWFGALKLLDVSPAGSLVRSLFDQTIPFVSFNSFYFSFAIFEMIIGILFVVQGMERVAIFLLGIHLFMTIMPLILLPSITWQAFLVPTLEGQYIIKNILIAALAVVIGARLAPAVFKKPRLHM